MAARSWIRSPAHLAALFVAVAAIPLGGLGWLGHRVLQQQADLDAERLQTQLANSATLLAREVDRALAHWESLADASLDSQPSTFPPDLSLVVLDAQGLITTGGLSLPYYPVRQQWPSPAGDALRAAETAEFQARDFVTAARLYADLVRYPDRQIASRAMLGASRMLQRLDRPRDAVAELDRLAGLAGATVGGVPTELVAHRRRLELFEHSGDRRAASAERAWLTATLASGRVPIDRATFDEYTDTLGLSPAPSPVVVAIADLIGYRWKEWLQTTGGRASTPGDATTLVSVWRRQGPRVAIVTGPADQLIATLEPLARDLNVRAHVADLSDGGARPIWGDPPQEPHHSRALRGDVGLSWSLTAAAMPEAADAGLSRQQLFGIGFVLLAVVVTGAAYTVFRFVSKELAVARLQSDFVSAVSHEFRTPLTALRHVSDLLEEGAAAPQDLPEFYRAIGKESRRLQALVENLLDFGKLEGGRHVYDFTDIDVVALTRDTVQDVADHAALNGHQLRVASPDERLSVRADRHAVVVALRNIIENAVKYSPGADAIDVRLRSDAAHVAIAVQDYGVGVPHSEHRDVFRKFVRGASARALMIKGTGIGLAMADRIVRDHGGSITLESAPGQGSTFTVHLPRSYGQDSDRRG